MTRFTGVGGGNMLRRLATGVGAVMTTDAVGHDIGMIHLDREPGQRVVTSIAGLHGEHMGRAFAAGNHIIVATVAAADDLRVVHRRHWHR